MPRVASVLALALPSSSGWMHQRGECMPGSTGVPALINSHHRWLLPCQWLPDYRCLAAVKPPQNRGPAFCPTWCLSKLELHFACMNSILETPPCGEPARSVLIPVFLIQSASAASNMYWIRQLLSELLLLSGRVVTRPDVCPSHSYRTFSASSVAPHHISS